MKAPRDGQIFEAALLRDFACALLQAGGFTEDQARQTADVLVWANLRGVDSHGVLRIPRYIEMVELGLINPAGIPRDEFSRGSIAVSSAQRAPGAVAMVFAARKALSLANDHGIGWCSMQGISHAGAIGYYAEQIAKVGHVAIVMTASKPLMAYHGSKVEGVSTNPIAIAAPTLDPDRPLLLDMSTASVALGKIMAAKDAGKSIPLGWGVDRDGNDTTDPAKVAAVLPMAGPKGSGLSLMIEVLTSVLASNPLISVALSSGSDPGANGVAVALDPKAFRNQSFAADVSAVSDAIKTLPVAADTDKIFLPGERGFDEADRRRVKGITVTAGTLSKLSALASTLGVSMPGAFRHSAG
ncbi:MAG: Ldh family oxidoreductase [Proteobacteria bacterium]|nr:Ldh family oxidoreductase [Pseudomonadota bacterium]